VSVRLADPLPECLGCSRPTRRATWTANGGLCTDCQTGLVEARSARYTTRLRRSQ
jgi:hypothetical protein